MATTKKPIVRATSATSVPTNARIIDELLDIADEAMKGKPKDLQGLKARLKALKAIIASRKQLTVRKPKE